MQLLVEPRVRRIVADHLGVTPQQLSGRVSLVDDLAADSLDLVELAMALEGEFGIMIPERTLDALRTYDDVVACVSGRLLPDKTPSTESSTTIATRVIPVDGSAGCALFRAGWLTPYSAETIAEDALGLGPGTQLEITVPSGTTDTLLHDIETQFAWLGAHGVQVSVHRDPLRAGPMGQHASPHAAAYPAA